MTDNWSPAGDFIEVVDTLEPVTVLRCGRPDHALVAQAWRFEESRSDSTQAPGVLTRKVTTWQLYAPEDESPPKPGDRLIYDQTLCATIRSVKRQQGATRLVCEAVGYEVLPGARQVFDVQRPIVANGQGGSTIERWELDQTSVEGCFLQVEKDPLAESAPVEVVLIGLSSLQVGARLHRRRGGALAVVAVEPPGAIGDPWLVTAEEIIA